MTFRLVSTISRNETRTTSRSLEITLSLVFNYSRNKERIFRGRAETRNFSSSVEKHFTSEPFLSNCFIMNLKFQDAAQRHFVFVECYVVKLLSCVA